jgi:DNA repair protein RadC
MLQQNGFDPAPRLVRDAAAARVLFAALAEERLEVAAFAYLGEDRRLLGLRHSRSASPHTHELPIRDVAADALAFGADALVMAHNHPSGDATPSRADRDATCRLARALDALGVRLIDHLVIARGETTSFRALGLL